MKERPYLDKMLDASEFVKYYYLKQELINFCKENEISTIGGKIELTDRIIKFLDTGIKEKAKPTIKKYHHTNMNLNLETIIEDEIKCSEVHRKFFKQQLGNSFSFNVMFQNWLKHNAGKTYKEACEAYLVIKKEKKNATRIIDKQFEYNTYIRDFFISNKGKSLDDAIRCWKYKKSLSGHNTYEHTDLVAIDHKTKI